jgi:hypothetical protein
MIEKILTVKSSEYDGAADGDQQLLSSAEQS